MMLFYTGMAWCADAMEMMLLSFLGPAVSLNHLHWLWLVRALLSKQHHSLQLSVLGDGLSLSKLCHRW